MIHEKDYFEDVKSWITYSFEEDRNNTEAEVYKNYIKECLLAIQEIIEREGKKAARAAPEKPTVKWERSYGDSDYGEVESVVQTSDGGFALAGDTESYGAGGTDFWLAKLSGEGRVQYTLATSAYPV